MSGDPWTSVTPALRESTLKTLARLNFTNMTPVQSATIPVFLSNKDVAVQACTGSGKTLAFIVPILEILLRKPNKLRQEQIGAVIITPTRELAIQISEVIGEFLKDLKDFSKLLLIGGSPVEDDYKKNGGNIIVCTPGRMLDFIEQLKFNLKFKEMEVLVLDEADRLLEMGFDESLREILKNFPKQRRTGLFSATQTQKLRDLLRAGLRNPVRVEVKVSSTTKRGGTQATPTSLQNFYIKLPLQDKLNQLAHILKEFHNLKVIVYFVSRASSDYFSQMCQRLKLVKVPIYRLHGGVVQERRTELFKKFSDAEAAILFTTDLSARGLDIPNVDWVIQYLHVNFIDDLQSFHSSNAQLIRFEAPKDPKTFVHRIGRTARMGKLGQSIIFLAPNEMEYIEVLSSRNVPIKEMKKYEGVENVTDRVKEYIRNNRDLYDLSRIAYVSFIRAYKEHLCQFVFKLDELDVVGLANGFGMLRLPGMPELKTRDVSAFQSITEEEEDAIPFENKRKDGQRKADLRKAEGVKKAAEERKRKREEEEAANPEAKKAKEEAEANLTPEQLQRRAKIQAKRKGKKERKEKREQAKEEKKAKKKFQFKKNIKYKSKKFQR